MRDKRNHLGANRFHQVDSKSPESLFMNYFPNAQCVICRQKKLQIIVLNEKKYFNVFFQYFCIFQTFIRINFLLISKSVQLLSLIIFAKYW